MTTEKFLPIEKEYRPSLVICLGLMTLLVIFLGISMCYLVQYQNARIAEIEKDLANEWQEDHAIRLYLAELDARIEEVAFESAKNDFVQGNKLNVQRHKLDNLDKFP